MPQLHDRLEGLNANLRTMDYGDVVPVRSLDTDENPWVALPLSTLEELVSMVFLFSMHARRARFDSGPHTLPLVTAKTPPQLAYVLRREARRDGTGD